jgi:hypothetical protein
MEHKMQGTPGVTYTIDTDAEVLTGDGSFEHAVATLVNAPDSADMICVAYYTDTRTYSRVESERVEMAAVVRGATG